MAVSRSITKPSFGLPSAQCVERISSAEKVERLRSINFNYETRMADLERQFEVLACDLREKYISEILAVHEGSGE